MSVNYGKLLTTSPMGGTSAVLADAVDAAAAASGVAAVVVFDILAVGTGVSLS